MSSDLEAPKEAAGPDDLELPIFLEDGPFAEQVRNHPLHPGLYGERNGLMIEVYQFTGDHDRPAAVDGSLPRYRYQGSLYVYRP